VNRTIVYAPEVSMQFWKKNVTHVKI